VAEYVPRSMEATTTAAAVRVQSQRVSQPNGWWGMVILIASESMYFVSLIGAYYYLRFHDVAWPPPGTPKPPVVVPLILAGSLAATSVPMQLGWLAAKAGRVRAAWSAVALAGLVQMGYLAYEIRDLIDELGKSKPQKDAYDSIYYTLLGSDHAHVALGILFTLWLLVRTASGLTNYRLIGFRAIVFYWHFVNLLTLIVIGVLLTPDM
jgi:heme/copper-type cytochrome/quinol oxidase subunit 3